MAGAGYKLFNTGDVLTAAQVNTYLQEQVVMVFASATARTTALTGVLSEGMVSYLQDTNAVEVYDGSAWVSIGASGDITGVTAGTGISGGGTSGTVTITNAMATEITAAGDIIVGTGSGTFDNLPIGTTGQVLTADTTVSPYKVKWATAGGGDWVKIIKQTASGVATATLSNVFSATYDIYKIFGEFYFQAADSMRVRLRTGSTNSTTGYYFQSLTVDGTTVTGARTSNTTGMSAGGGSDENRCSFEMMVMSPYLADPTKFITQSEYATTVKTQWVGGIHDVGTSYESCQFYGNGGQNIVGTFYVYGLKA